MLLYANLHLRTREEFKGVTKPSHQVVVTQISTPLEEGHVFPPDLLPAGVKVIAPIRIEDRIECSAEGEFQATVDLFAQAYVEHEDGWDALLEAFAKDEWLSYLGGNEE